jgi:hypothetical protein
MFPRTCLHPRMRPGHRTTQCSRARYPRTLHQVSPCRLTLLRHAGGEHAYCSPGSGSPAPCPPSAACAARGGRAARSGTPAPSAARTRQGAGAGSRREGRTLIVQDTALELPARTVGDGVDPRVLHLPLVEHLGAAGPAVLLHQGGVGRARLRHPGRETGVGCATAACGQPRAIITTASFGSESKLFIIRSRTKGRPAPRRARSPAPPANPVERGGRQPCARQRLPPELDHRLLSSEVPGGFRTSRPPWSAARPPTVSAWNAITRPSSAPLTRHATTWMAAGQGHHPAEAAGAEARPWPFSPRSWRRLTRSPARRASLYQPVQT